MAGLSSFASRLRLRPAALAAVVANVGIVLTGGIVRVTGSGLGCDDWPTCEGSSVVPTGNADAGWHQFIEFGNRLLTFVLLAVAVWVVLAARREAADRLDLQRLAWAQPAGILGQAVLGGITVLTDLHPLVVAGHFLLSMVVLGAAVVLHHRVATQPRRRDPGGSAMLRHLATALVAVGALVLVLGTIVTATGPHAGDPGTPRFTGLTLRTAALLHADGVWLLVGLSVAALLVARATGDRVATRAATVLLVVEVAQGGIGYLQYALAIPPALVSMHLVGASLLWIAVVRLRLEVAPDPTPFTPLSATAADPARRPATAEVDSEVVRAP